MTSIIAALVLLSSVVNAAPVADPAADALATLEARGSGLACYYPASYQNLVHVKKWTDPILKSGNLVTAGNSISLTSAYEQSVSFTGGISASVSFEALFELGGDASVTVTYSSGTSVSESLLCPTGTGMCGAVAQGQVIQITGQQKVDPCEGAATSPVVTTKPPANCAVNGVCSVGSNSANYSKWLPFTAIYPVKVSGGNTLNGVDEMVVLWSPCYVTGYAAGPLTIPCPGLSATSASVQAAAAKLNVKAT